MVAASDPERHEAALAEATVERGFDLFLQLREDGDESADQALELLLGWLEGRRLSDRADEPELRLLAAEDALEYFGDPVWTMHRYHAQAVLALPQGHEERDVPEAVDELSWTLDVARAEKDADEAVLTIAALLDADAGDEALLDEGEQWAQQADESFADTFLIAAEAFCSSRHITARDAGDRAQAERWLERHARYLPEDEDEGLGAVVARAARHDMAGEWAEAAAGYRTVVEASDLERGDVQQLALREGELQLMLGEHERAVEGLEALLPYAEARYLTAVTDDDVHDAQERLDAVADALAASLARRDDWDGALRAFDRAGGLRGRYRAALRADPAGRELLALERELDAAARGAPTDAVADDGVPARARLLERYRQVRPRLDAGRLASPSVADVGAVLEPCEAVAAIGFHFTGTVGVLVAPGDREQPAGRLLLEDVGTLQWLELFAGEEDGDGDWLPALNQPGSGLEPEPGLSRVLAGIDEIVGQWLRGLLDGHRAHRLTVVPDTMLHLIPWQALPSLRDVDIVMAASVSEVVRARRAAAAAVPREALVVANPTLDLRVSAAACRPVAQRLTSAGFTVTALADAGATEAALLGAAGGRSLLHFAGHGRSERMRSGLELHPDAALTGGGDPFAAWLEQAGDWRDVPGDDDDDEAPWTERFADVPGAGRLAERRWTHADLLERRLEHAGGTLVADYAGDRLVRLAELLSATDLILAEGLGSCRLAVLVACASGAGVGRNDEAQAGVPVALQLAGIDSVIGTHWEVEEGFAALWAESFYAGLEQAGARVDLAALVRRTGDELRAIGAAAARERLLALADGAGDPYAAMELEAYAYRLPDPPFAAPAQWAAFYVIGRPTIEFEEAAG